MRLLSAGKLAQMRSELEAARVAMSRYSDTALECHKKVKGASREDMRRQMLDVMERRAVRRAAIDEHEKRLQLERKADWEGELKAARARRRAVTRLVAKARGSGPIISYPRGAGTPPDFFATPSPRVLLGDEVLFVDRLRSAALEGSTGRTGSLSRSSLPGV
jgi:hypothetical protein